MSFYWIGIMKLQSLNSIDVQCDSKLSKVAAEIVHDCCSPQKRYPCKKDLPTSFSSTVAQSAPFRVNLERSPMSACICMSWVTFSAQDPFLCQSTFYILMHWIMFLWQMLDAQSLCMGWVTRILNTHVESNLITFAIALTHMMLCRLRPSQWCLPSLHARESVSCSLWRELDGCPNYGVHNLFAMAD